jgi:hypothetical protein
MTDEELRTLVASLAVTTASNTEAISELRATVESQERTMIEGFESQARSIESMRESITYNVDTMASALELAAISQRTAAAAQETTAATAAANMELSANILKAIDRSEQNIARLEQMMGIVISEGRADRTRITRLEEQN